MSDLELTMMRRVGELNKENASLKAEVDDLRLENQAFQRTVNEASAHYDNRLADISRLKAEVERLTKAGDELGEWFMDIHPSKKKWNAAKEGKQP